MYHKMFRITLLVTAVAMILAACGVSTPATAPTVPTQQPAAAITLPFTHCLH
jgi:ABC-type glycerol-3-phosphate transport system substrate-binding protein